MKFRISSFSVILVFVCLSLVGLALIPFLPTKLSPSQTLPYISVYFNMPQNSSQVVEIEVTSVLEAMFARMKGLKNISSVSGNGWGQINLALDKHTDMDAARFEVSTIIRQTWPYLPSTVRYPSLSLRRSENNADLPFLTYTINSPNNPSQIQYFAESKIKPKLAQIEGVSQVLVSGAMPLEWRLEYNAKQLEELNLNVNHIQSAIQNYLNQEFLGTVSIEKEDDKIHWIRVALLPEIENNQSFAFENVQVKSVNGKIITLDQLVKVSHQEKEAQSYFRINGLNSIYISITADEYANQLKLSKEIKSTLAELEKTFPPNYEIHAGYDATDYIQKELNKVYFRSGLTILILFVFILIVYRNLKHIILIFLSLLMNLFIALIFYYFGKLEIQLYSLAGITISLTLIIDNTIIMSDQIIRQKNRKAFLAILTATITTIASLIIIFFMDEQIRIRLLDFAKVIMINLSVSLFTALFLVPALIDKLNMGKEEMKENTSIYSKKENIQRKISIRARLAFDRFYTSFCRFIWRKRVVVCIFIILIFGLPIYLLPEKIDREGQWEDLYNKTLGSVFYKEKIKPHGDVFLGGTLRLFAQKVIQGSYFTDREETSLHVTATLPEGATISQMNNLIRRMETYISQFEGVRLFQTNVSGAYRASIRIYFTKEGEEAGFPFYLQTQLIGKAQELGGGSWNVFGLGDRFNNDVREFAGNFQIILKGYNYDDLWVHAEELKSRLLTNRRIQDVRIAAEFSDYKDYYEEFIFKLDKKQLAHQGIQPIQLFTSLRNTFGRNLNAGSFPGDYGMEEIILNSRQSGEYDMWALENYPGLISTGKEFRLNSLAHIEKSTIPKNIVKEDQQYILCIQYNYVGDFNQGKRFTQGRIEEFQKELPIGYKVEFRTDRWDWGKKNSKQYWLLLLIFVIVYFTCSILFNSMRQPFAVIFVIPISFIGIFLTFYWFKLNFDQGGFASFILLCGLSVNANIYILNEYNNIRRERNILPIKAYIKAWNQKIVPILLTVISSILGFIPFLIGSSKEAFWFPLAAGTIGGLIVSLLGTFLFLPLFLGVGKPNSPTSHPLRKGETNPSS